MDCSREQASSKSDTKDAVYTKLSVPLWGGEVFIEVEKIRTPTRAVLGVIVKSSE